MAALSSRSLLSACMDDIDKTAMIYSTASSKTRSIDSALSDQDNDKCQYRPTKEASKLNEVTEKNGYSELMNALSKQEIEDMSDYNLPLRHFRADGGSLKKAIVRLKYAIKWRNDFKVNEMLKSAHNPSSESEVEIMIRSMLINESSSGKVYVRGHDKEGRAILYMRQQRENTNHEENNIKHLVYQIERAIACTEKNGFEKFTVIMDFEGWNLSHASSMKVTKETIHVMQECYVERVGRVFFANAPVVFRTFYNMVKPFLDASTKAKILFCSGKASKIELKRVFHEATTERCIFGTEGLRVFDAEEYYNQPLDASFDEKNL